MAEVNTPPALDMRMVEGTLRLHRKLASSGLYLAVLVVFLLPFVSVSCGSQTVLTLSGLDLMIGRDLGTQFGTSAPLGITAGHLDSHPWLLLALLLPIAGLVLTLMEPGVHSRVAAIALTSVGGLGLLLMLIVLGNITATNNVIQNSACQGQPACVNVAAAVQVNPAGGVWLEALLDIAMAALGVLWLRRWLAVPSNPASEPSQPPAPG